MQYKLYCLKSYTWFDNETEPVFGSNLVKNPVKIPLIYMEMSLKHALPLSGSKIIA